MKRHSLPVVTAAFAMTLLGCTTMPSTTSSPTSGDKARNPLELAYLRLFAPTQFKTLIKEQNWENANSFYSKHSDILEAETKEAVIALANYNSSSYTEAFGDFQKRALVSKVDSADDLKLIATTLEEGRALISRYSAQPALQLPERWSGAATATKAWLDSAQTKTTAIIEKNFLGYRHAEKPLYFSQQELQTLAPKNVRDEIIGRNLPLIVKAIIAAPAKQLSTLGAEYSSYLTQTDKMTIKESLVRRETDRKQLSSLQDLLQTQKFLESIGFPKLLVRFGRTGTSAGQVSIDGSLVSQIVDATSLQRAIRTQDDDARHILLVDKSASIRYFALGQPREIKRRQQVGVRSTKNPNIQDAADRLRQAEADFARAEAENNANNKRLQAASGSSRSGAEKGLEALLLGLKTSSVISAQERMDAARKELESMPPTIDEPIYKTVTVAESTREDIIVDELRFYWIDTLNRKVRKGSEQFNRRSTVSDSATPPPESGATASNLFIRAAQADAKLTASRSFDLATLEAVVMTDQRAFQERIAAAKNQTNQNNRAVMDELVRRNESLPPNR